MQAAIATLAVACLVGTGGLVTCVVFLWKLHREARRDMSSLSDTHDALLDANHNTHKANLQLQETSHEYAEYKRRTDSQLKAVQESADEQRATIAELRLELSKAGVRGAAADALADGLRRIRETATRRGTGESGKGPAAVPHDRAPDTTGGGGGTD